MFGEPTLTNVGVDIDSEGVFEFPHIGRVKAGGMTVRQIEQEVTRLLSPPQGYFRSPQVTVTIERYQPQVVWVQGQVRSPGAVQMQGSMSVMEAIAKAGSQLADAGPYVEIYRHEAGAPVTGPANPAQAKTVKPPERVSMADIATRSGLSASTAATNLSIGTSTPRSITSKPAPSMTMPTRALPMP